MFLFIYKIIMKMLDYVYTQDVYTHCLSIGNVYFIIV